MTAKPTDIQSYFKNFLETEKSSLGLHDVYEGDQNLIPFTPVACVVLGDTNRDLVGAPRRVDERTRIIIIVYHCALKDQAKMQREANERAEKIVDLIDPNKNLEGLVVHGMVISSEPGFMQRTNNWFYATRITWEGYTRFNLGGV